MKKSMNYPLGKSSMELLDTIKKKKTIVDKLTKFFSNKFNKLIKENKYSINNLEQLITNFFDSYQSNKINEYDYVIGILEKNIQDSIIKHALNNNNFSKNGHSSPNNITNDHFDYEKNEIENNNGNNTNDYYNNYNRILNKSVIDIDNDIVKKSSDNKTLSKENLEKQKIDNKIIHHQRSKSTNINMELPVLLYSNNRLMSLKEKANDEWALIAKFNYIKQQEEEKQNKFNKEEKQKKFKESLHSQLIEKDLLKKIKQEEDWQFFLRQNDKLQILQSEEQKRNKQKLDMLKAEKEIQDKIVSDIKNRKQENIIKEKENEKLALEKIRTEMELERERVSKKKIEEREMYLNLIKENEKRQEQKKNQKELIKHHNLKYLKEVDELLENQEKERSVSTLRARPVNDYLEAKTIVAKEKEDLLKSQLENKYLKEKQEIENKMKVIEELNKFRKHKQIEEMKKALKDQIEEKKKKDFDKKEFDLKYHEIVKFNTQKFNEDKETVVKNSLEKINNYKSELDKQLGQKSQKKKFMDDHEKEYNNKLLKKIYTELDNKTNN